MKFYLATALYCLSLTKTNAFSAVAPNAAKMAPSVDPVDKSMTSLPKETNAFDPTAGENAALQRNNKNEVWVPQVRTKDVPYTTTHSLSCLSHNFSPSQLSTARTTPPKP
jgi:hypothetical protein